MPARPGTVEIGACQPDVAPWQIGAAEACHSLTALPLPLLDFQLMGALSNVVGTDQGAFFFFCIEMNVLF